MICCIYVCVFVRSHTSYISVCVWCWCETVGCSQLRSNSVTLGTNGVFLYCVTHVLSLSANYLSIENPVNRVIIFITINGTRKQGTFCFHSEVSVHWWLNWRTCAFPFETSWWNYSGKLVTKKGQGIIVKHWQCQPYSWYCIWIQWTWLHITVYHMSL